LVKNKLFQPETGYSTVKTILKALCLLCSLVLGTVAYAEGPGYHVVRKLHLGGEGRWDYPTVDSAGRRLYLSRSTHVMVVDIDNGKIAGNIPDTAGVHGIAVAPELNRGFTSNGKSNTSTIFDLKTLKVLGQVKTGAGPDAILYDPAAGRVFTFNGRDRDATVFDASSGKVLGTIALGGKPEFAATDAKGRVYVNIEDKGEVAEIDSRKLKILNRYSIRPCENPTGMAIDAGHGRVFSGCRNRIMTVLDTKTGRVIATVPIGIGVDGAGFDPGTGLIFSSNGEGSLTVVRESNPEHFEVVETVSTEVGARTMAIDTGTHDIYLPTAKFSSPPLFAKPGPRRRPKIVAGSFVVLVVGQ
jgi:DNA-binding beta-propeller fold protein YncE